jgi:hypothetical protein
MVIRTPNHRLHTGHRDGSTWGWYFQPRGRLSSKLSFLSGLAKGIHSPETSGLQLGQPTCTGH